MGHSSIFGVIWGLFLLWSFTKFSVLTIYFSMVQFHRGGLREETKGFNQKVAETHSGRFAFFVASHSCLYFVRSVYRKFCLYLYHTRLFSTQCLCNDAGRICVFWRSKSCDLRVIEANHKTFNRSALWIWSRSLLWHILPFCDSSQFYPHKRFHIVYHFVCVRGTCLLHNLD